ncbi:MAG: LEA type 2 family protein [Nitrososphaera sp.]|nr:LEA type 2 family protein [Candidatus Nitrosotalea sp.]HVZ62181.1 LEA type 2 family protein [Candidatus Nitrosotalea sp.]
MISKGRLVIIACFAGLGAMMLFFYLYANSFQGDLDKVIISVDSIKVLDENKIDKRAHLDVRFNLQNPTSIVLTVSTINYQIYANGNNIGEGHFTTEDIPEAGRPALFANSNLTLPTTFDLVNSDQIAKEYSEITTGQPIKYEVKGQVTIESFLTAIIKDFDLSFG